MYQDKTLVCKDCGAEFVFTAATQRRMQANPREKCTLQSAQTAEKKLRFLSSPQATDLFTAANAMRQ